MKFHDLSGTATVAHKVFDTWSARETQHKSEGIPAQHLLDSVPDLRGRVLHVTIHQVQQSVPTEVVCEVFSAYGEVAEMFQSLPLHSHTQAPSLFIEYEHGTTAATALHDLHGVCLYPNDCQLDIRHATLKELHTFYGYSTPRFSEEQLELLQQIQRDLAGLKEIVTCGMTQVRRGNDLAPTPPSQLNPSVDVCSVSTCVPECIEDQHNELEHKQSEQNLMQAPEELQFELENYLIPASINLGVESATEEQLQESSSPPLVALSVATPILPEVNAQSDDQVENILTSIAFQLRQPEPPLVHGSNWKQETPSQMQLTHMLALVPCSSNAQESSANNSDLCGHIKNTPLMLPWDPGTQCCVQWESNGQIPVHNVLSVQKNNDMELDFGENLQGDAPEDNDGTDEKHTTQSTDENEENCMINQVDMLTDECAVNADAMLQTEQNCSANFDVVATPPSLCMRKARPKITCAAVTGSEPSNIYEAFWHPTELAVKLVMPSKIGDKATEAVPVLPFEALLAAAYSDVTQVTTSTSVSADMPQDAQGLPGMVQIQLTINNDFAHIIKPMAVYPQSRLEMFRTLQRSSSSPLFEEICTNWAVKRQNLAKLDKIKPSLSFERHLLSLAIMCNEAVLWPIIQSATGNDILLQPWDPGLPLFGMYNKLSTYKHGLLARLPTTCGVVCLQSHSMHEFFGYCLVVATILPWIAKLMEMQAWLSRVQSVMVALMQLQPQSSGELSDPIRKLARCARYTAWIWCHIENLHYIHGSTKWAIPHWGVHTSFPEILVFMYCHYARVNFQRNTAVQRNTSSHGFSTILNGRAEIHQHYSCPGILTDADRNQCISHHIWPGTTHHSEPTEWLFLQSEFGCLSRENIEQWKIPWTVRLVSQKFGFLYCSAERESVQGGENFQWTIAWSIGYYFPLPSLQALFSGASSEYGRHGIVTLLELSVWMYPPPHLYHITLKILYADNNIAQLSYGKMLQALLSDCSLSQPPMIGGSNYLTSRKSSTAIFQLVAYVAIWSLHSLLHIRTFVQLVASLVLGILDTYSSDIQQVMGGKRHEPITALPGRAHRESTIHLFPVILHLLGSVSFSHRVVPHRILLQLANLMKKLETPFQAWSDFQITLLRVLETAAEEPSAILKEHKKQRSNFLRMVLPDMKITNSCDASLTLEKFKTVIDTHFTQYVMSECHIWDPGITVYINWIMELWIISFKPP